MLNQKMRYRFYREHKYVSYILSEFERLIAKTDFNETSQVAHVAQQLSAIWALMCGHAEYENTTLHALLRNKGSSVHQAIESDHEEHEKHFKDLEQKLKIIIESSIPQERVLRGYEFYLAYRLFVSESLRHLYEEEAAIMPELQRLYTDDELRAVKFHTYSRMSIEQIIHMIEVLFPHMDSSDREVFLWDVKEAEPKKFAKAWVSISPKLSLEEREGLKNKLGIKTRKLKL